MLPPVSTLLRDCLLPLVRGIVFVLHLDCCLFFIYALHKWNIINLTYGATRPDPTEFTRLQFPTKITPPESVKTLATAGTSISESCGWLNTFINDIYFRMNDGELIRTIKENFMEKFINSKIAAIKNEYNKLVGKIVLSDLTIKSLPTITAVHVATAQGIDQDAALIFDFEYHGGITFQIVTKSPVIGSVKFDTRVDYFKSKFVLHLAERSGEKQWIFSLSEAPRISIELGVGKHSLSGAARIIQKALHDLLQKNIVYPNLYKYVVRNNLIGFKNSLFKIDDAKGNHYAIKIVRGRNLPIKHDLKGPFVTVTYGERSFKSGTGKCIPSPLFGATFHFVFQEKVGNVKIAVAQKDKLSGHIRTLAQFEFPLALFTKSFHRVRFGLDGSVLSEFNRMASYISVDLIYYEKRESVLEPLAHFLYGSEAELRLKDAGLQTKKKTSNLLTILKATKKEPKKPQVSYSSSDLLKYLEGQQTTSRSDVQFLQNNLRDKTTGLSRFWGQQMEILRGSKKGEASFASLSDISDSINNLSQDILKFLISFQSLQRHEIDVTFEELNDLCDQHDSLGNSITRLFRLLGLKSAKDFKFLPQILEYLKEISILLGQINFTLYNNREVLSDTEQAESEGSPTIDKTSGKFVLDESVASLPNTPELLSEDEGFFEGEDVEPAFPTSEGAIPEIMVGEEEPLASETSPYGKRQSKTLSPSPSIVSTFNLTSSEDLAGTYCRLFRNRCTFQVKEYGIEFKPNYQKLIDSSQEGIFYLIDSEQVPRILTDNSFSSLKPEKRVVGHVAGQLISFSLNEKMNFSSLLNISCIEVSKLTVRNVKNSHLNLIKFEFAVGNKAPIYVAGEKSVALKFFSAIASWMLHYDLVDEKYFVNYSDISSLKQTKSTLQICVKVAATVKGTQELISNSALLMRDFFGQSQKQSAFNSISTNINASLVSNIVQEVNEETEDFVFARRSVSSLPHDFYFENFRLIGKQAPRNISECSIAGLDGQVSIGSDGVYFKSSRIYYMIPFSKVQSLRLVSGILVKGIRISLTNGETVGLTGFKKGYRQPFFGELNEAYSASKS